VEESIFLIQLSTRLPLLSFVRNGHEPSEVSICTAFEAVIFISEELSLQDCKIKPTLKKNKSHIFFMIDIF
jgi:hypothetical protein